MPKYLKVCPCNGFFGRSGPNVFCRSREMRVDFGEKDPEKKLGPLISVVSC